MLRVACQSVDLQIFTHPKSRSARKAERFFSERGIRFHAVDVRRRKPSPGELEKWVRRFGVDRCLDRSSKAFTDAGLGYLSASDADWIERMARNPEILDLPLVRCGKELSVGDDPDAWQRFAEALKG